MHQRAVQLISTVLSLAIDNCKICGNRTRRGGGKYGSKGNGWIEEVSILLRDAIRL